MPEIVKRATFDRKYTGIAKFPAVNRDISMVMPKEILAGQVEEVIEKKGGAYLESYALFDLYEGARLKKDISPWHIPSYSAQRIRLWKTQK